MPCEHQENASVDTEKLGKVWRPMDPHHFGACTIQIQVSEDETRRNEKLEVVKSALGKVLAATRIQLPLLYLYLCPKVRCIAFMGEAGGNRTYHMFLGDKVCGNGHGSAHQACLRPLSASSNVADRFRD
jgi:hypothetical protein